MNLSKDMGNPASLNFQKTTVRGHVFMFSPNIINQYWECDDVPENEEEVLEIDPTVSLIIRGKVLMWLYKYNLHSSHLTSRYSILHKIVMCNWLSTTQCTTVIKSFAILLFQIIMIKKVSLGRLLFKHILSHAEHATYRKAIGYPSLIFRILRAQKPNLVTPTNILRPPTTEMRINHKLYEGHHLRDVPLGRKKKEKVPKTIPASELAITPKGKSSSAILMKFEILNGSIQSHDNILAHLYEQQCWSYNSKEFRSNERSSLPSTKS